MEVGNGSCFTCSEEDERFSWHERKGVQSQLYTHWGADSQKTMVFCDCAAVRNEQFTGCSNRVFSNIQKRSTRCRGGVGKIPLSNKMEWWKKSKVKNEGLKWKK